MDQHANDGAVTPPPHIYPTTMVPEKYGELPSPYGEANKKVAGAGQNFFERLQTMLLNHKQET